MKTTDGEGRPLYRVEGREVGRGLSGEPLLTDARIAGCVGAGTEITVGGAGVCSVYLRALLERWAEAPRPALAKPGAA